MAKMAAENPAFMQVLQQNPLAIMNLLMSGNPNAVQFSGGADAGMPGMGAGAGAGGAGAGAGAGGRPGI